MAFLSGIPIGGRIGLLLVGAVFPLATLGAVYAWSAGETAREAEMRARYETARVVAGVVESVVEGTGRATDVALSGEGVGTDPERCTNALERLLQLVPVIDDAVILSGSRRICGLARRDGGLVPFEGTVALADARADATMAIGGTAAPAIRIVRTLGRMAGPVAVLHVGLDPIWHRVTTSIAGLGRARVFLLTEAGGVIADPEGTVESSQISAVIAAVGESIRGGLPVIQVAAPGIGYVAIARVASTSLRVAVTSDVGTIDNSMPVRLALVAGLPFLFLVAAVGIAWIGVDRLVNRWVRRLARATSHYGAGDLSVRVGGMEAAPEEFRALGASFDAMAARIEGRSADLERALSEKNHFVRELHHRVKNNFQMIASLLTLQRREADPSAEPAIREAHDRVQALAAAYRASYADSDTGQVPVSGLVVDLVERLRESARLPSRTIAIDELGEGISLHLDRAIPFALLFTELVVPLLDELRERDDTLRISSGWVSEASGTLYARITQQRRDLPPPRALADRLSRAYAAQLGATVRREGHRIEVVLDRTAA